MKRTVVILLLVALVTSVAGLSGLGNTTSAALAGPADSASRCQAQRAEFRSGSFGFAKECTLAYRGPRLTLAGEASAVGRSTLVWVAIELTWPATGEVLADCYGEAGQAFSSCYKTKNYLGRPPPIGTPLTCEVRGGAHFKTEGLLSIAGLCTTAQL